MIPADPDTHRFVDTTHVRDCTMQGFGRQSGLRGFVAQIWNRASSRMAIFRACYSECSRLESEGPARIANYGLVNKLC